MSERKPYTIWSVGEEELKLKLTTSVITELEEKLKGNLINIIRSDTLPPLKMMLAVVHGACKKFSHGKSYKDIEVLFDSYVDEGGSQMDFLTDVVLPLYQASGFFSEAQAEEMEKAMDEAKSLI